MIFSGSILNETVYIDNQNGNFSIRKEELLSYGSYPIDKAPDYSHNLYSSMTFCLEISNACNLQCSYCFNQKKDGRRMTIQTAKKSLDYLFHEFSHAQKYFIDISGAGEPLLSMGLIEQLAQYAEAKSNEIDKEVILCFVSNGTLLSSTIVKKLQKMNVLFGVSIDGEKNNHDVFRKDREGDGTFDSIFRNISHIKEREYLGCAVTLTRNVFDLNDSISFLKTMFQTISIKPVRSKTLGIDWKSLEQWKSEYEKLEIRLEKEIYGNDFSTLFSLLNGDDFFGKFLCRSFLDAKSLSRCDCATGRIAVSVDGLFYPCPALIDSSFALGDFSDGFRSDAAAGVYRKQVERKHCADCPFRFACGGECLAESEKPDAVMCEFKKHLILLSMILEEHCRSFPMVYRKIYQFCVGKKERQKENPKFREFREKHLNLSFVEAKAAFYGHGIEED